ncbi:hornerin [Drosophila sechellia]|uniref:GM19123 n=1 Tax=Drosophila sechellia TaxID=7238 RepID=B4I9B3_DROSE|nr:hornerin [Drosophila sechellia]EDW43794.1 GM19123 [Drosophila sechellia]
MKLPLACAVLSCCFFLLAAASSSPAADASSSQPASASSSAETSSSAKPKRDAGLSFGGISSYHGPSHKYLPPAYESHLNLGSFHGNPLGSAGYSDYPSHFKGESSYGHHFAHGHSGSHGYASSSIHGRPHHYSGSGVPKIETYIVQTSGASSSGHNYHGQGHGHGIGHGISHGISHGLSHGHGSGLAFKYAPSTSGAYLNLVGNEHKTSTYVVATPEYSGHSHGARGSTHGIGYGSAPAHRPSYGGHLQSHGYGSGFVHGPSHQIAHESVSHGPSQSLDHGLEHALEHGLSHALGLGHSSGGQFAQHPLPQPEEHSGYSYDAPATPFGKGVPLSSYGVPLIPGYDHQESLPEPVQVQVLEQEHKGDREQERETPVYALGHKGLGHFSYTASKPQALHTDVLSSAHHSVQSGAPSHDLDVSKAPFRPSAFLGAKHESGSNSISGYDYATPSSTFLQAPSSPGYDYQAPAQLYGPPGHSGDSATPIFEPEATYLPPASSYGPTATSSHGYH